MQRLVATEEQVTSAARRLGVPRGVLVSVVAAAPNWTAVARGLGKTRDDLVLAGLAPPMGRPEVEVDVEAARVLVERERLSQEEAALQLGVKRSTLGDRLRGRRTIRVNRKRRGDNE